MPHFRIETNLPRNKIPQDFVSKVIPVLAKSLGKPEQYCVVSVIPDVLMSFGGSTEPCGIANLMSIGALGVEQNKKHAKVLFELVANELGISTDRLDMQTKGSANFSSLFESLFRVDSTMTAEDVALPLVDPAKQLRSYGLMRQHRSPRWSPRAA